MAIVTGSGTGIGEAIAAKFASAGDRVVLAGLEEGDLNRVSEDIRASGGVCVVIAGDVTDPGHRDDIIALALSEFGRLDILVNNAGLSGPNVIGPAIDEDIAHYERTMAVNLTAPYFLSQAAARVMREQGGGAIVNISSVGGSAAQLNGAAYCMTKAGLDAMARNQAVEWAPFGIRVNNVAPGDIRTATSDEAAVWRKSLDTDAVSAFSRTTPLGRQGTGAEIAEAVYFLASDAASFATGTTLRVDGGFLAY